MDAASVIVDGGKGVVQEMCYLPDVLYSQAYEGKDAEFRRQVSAVGRNYPVLGLQKFVEALDEVGVGVQEGGIKVVEEALLLLIEIQAGLQLLDNVVLFSSLCQTKQFLRYSSMFSMYERQRFR